MCSASSTPTATRPATRRWCSWRSPSPIAIHSLTARATGARRMTPSPSRPCATRKRSSRSTPRCCAGLGVILRAPVALAVNEWIAIGEGLRHEHHRLVAGRVAVGVELAEHIAHGARGLLVLRDRREPELAHGVDDAPLYRLQPVAERRQRAVQNDVHRVVEIGLLGEGGERLALDAFEVEFLVPG